MCQRVWPNQSLPTKFMYNRTGHTFDILYISYFIYGNRMFFSDNKRRGTVADTVVGT